MGVKQSKKAQIQRETVETILTEQVDSFEQKKKLVFVNLYA